MAKIIHIITGLNTGGAEMMLYKLVSSMNRERFQSTIISLTDIGKIGESIEALGVSVHTVGMRSGRPSPAAIWRLASLIRDLQPDLIQGWLPHGNLAALLAGVALGNKVPVLWNNRQSFDNNSDFKHTVTKPIRFCAKLSNYPRRIIYNSKKGMTQHETLGFKSTKSKVIPNGFDSDLFKPSIESYLGVRKELKLLPETKLIGLIARFHPIKDHYNFLRAASCLAKSYSDIRFILAGIGINEENTELYNWIQGLNLEDKVYLLDERNDIPRLTAALDIATNSSYSEGFPNVIGEAMACGIPCVVTDVGDSAWIVHNTGLVVPPQDPQALAKAWGQLLEMEPEQRKNLGEAARTRVKNEFSLNKIANIYESLYLEVLNEYQYRYSDR